MLRREIQLLAPTAQLKQEILSRHAMFLESFQEWKAAASSWMDAGDCCKAVSVFINSK